MHLTAFARSLGLVGWEMCIRESTWVFRWFSLWQSQSQVPVLAALLRRLHTLDAPRANELLGQLKGAAPSAQMRLAQCYLVVRPS
jgi:hypothetical protein